MENESVLGNGTCEEEFEERMVATVSRYLVPILVFVGVIGNSLILVVLNSQRMKTKTNLLLSFMACSDLVHAVGTFFYHLQLYQAYADFRHIYPRLQIPVLTIMRFSGMSSNWFGVSVTVERLLAIQNPLVAITRKRSIVKIALAISTSSLLICSQPLVCWAGGSEADCRGRVVFFYEQPTDAGWQFYCLVWEQLSAYCYIVVPVFLMFVCNAALIYFMQRQSSALLRFNSCRPEFARKRPAETERGSGGPRDSISDRRISCANGRNRRVTAKPKKEMQAAVVVLALSLTSACMSLPSAAGAIYYFAAWLLDALPADETRSWYATYIEISNLLFLAEKNLAVFIYCVTSARFRRRLWAVLRCQRTSELSPRLMLVPLSTTLTANLRSVAVQQEFSEAETIFGRV